MKKRQEKKKETKSPLKSADRNVRTAPEVSVALPEKFAESRGDIVDQAQDQIDADIQEQIYQSRQTARPVEGASKRNAHRPAERPDPRSSVER